MQKMKPLEFTYKKKVAQFKKDAIVEKKKIKEYLKISKLPKEIYFQYFS